MTEKLSQQRIVEVLRSVFDTKEVYLVKDIGAQTEYRFKNKDDEGFVKFFSGYFHSLEMTDKSNRSFITLLNEYGAAIIEDFLIGPQTGEKDLGDVKLPEHIVIDAIGDIPEDIINDFIGMKVYSFFVKESNTPMLLPEYMVDDLNSHTDEEFIPYVFNKASKELDIEDKVDENEEATDEDINAIVALVLASSAYNKLVGAAMNPTNWTEDSVSGELIIDSQFYTAKARGILSQEVASVVSSYDFKKSIEALKGSYTEGKWNAIKERVLTELDEATVEKLTAKYGQFVSNRLPESLAKDITRNIIYAPSSALPIREAVETGINRGFEQSRFSSLTSTTFNRKAFAYARVLAYSQESVEIVTFRAIVDDKTSPVCLSLNGTSWSIARAVESVNDFLSANTAAASMAAAPLVFFDKRSAVFGADAFYTKSIDGARAYVPNSRFTVANSNTLIIADQAALQSSFDSLGIVIPPVHYHCRSYLDREAGSSGPLPLNI